MSIWKKKIDKKILKNAHETTDINTAKKQFKIVAFRNGFDNQCICGKTGLVHIFTVENIYNNILLTVGSKCINNFKSEGLNKEKRYLLKISEYDEEKYFEKLEKPYKKTTEKCLLSAYKQVHKDYKVFNKVVCLKQKHNGELLINVMKEDKNYIRFLRNNEISLGPIADNHFLKYHTS